WRSLLFAHYRFGAVDLQNPATRLPSVVALAAGLHLDRPVQERLATHVAGGGGLLLLGPAPQRDLEGRACSVLLEAMGVGVGRTVRDGSRSFPSVRGRDWADLIPETRVGWLQELEPGGATPVLEDVHGRVCGVEARVGAGRVVLLSAELPSMPRFFAAAASRLGVDPGLRVDSDVPGVVVTTTASPSGDRMLHVINPTGYSATVTVREHGEPFGGGPLRVPAHSGHFLPWGLTTPWGTIEASAAEVTGVSDDGVRFGPSLLARQAGQDPTA
ncbi:MAG: hypothetical protein ABIW80_05085, partial [Lapillicoccus sp.]